MATFREKARSVLLPGFKTGHTRYVLTVKSQFRDDCRWLDAGGGRRIFHDAYDGEMELVSRAQQVVVCDADPPSLTDHASVRDGICCDLNNIPLQSKSQDFVTCGMVVEHLSDPQGCLAELSRVLDDHGELIIHTVNLWGYPTQLALLAKLIPAGLRRRMVATLTGRLEEDIFPTHYRCNTDRKITQLLERAGFNVKVKHLNHGPLFKLLPFYLAELLLIRLTSIGLFKRLRGQLLVTATKAVPAKSC